MMFCICSHAEQWYAVLLKSNFFRSTWQKLKANFEISFLFFLKYKSIRFKKICLAWYIWYIKSLVVIFINVVKFKRIPSQRRFKLFINSFFESILPEITTTDYHFHKLTFLISTVKKKQPYNHAKKNKIIQRGVFLTQRCCRGFYYRITQHLLENSFQYILLVRLGKICLLSFAANSFP